VSLFGGEPATQISRGFRVERVRGPSSFGSVTTAHAGWIQKPMEASGDLQWQRWRLATDSSADQRLEVEVARKRARWQHPAIGPHGQRREGTRRGDTARLTAREKLRRVCASEEGGCFGSSPKPGEPHGRLRGATNPQAGERLSRRSREERHGRTALERWLARVERQASARLGGTLAGDVDGGAIFE
jgi:hypothetical protein